MEEGILEEVHEQCERDLRAAVRGPRRTAALRQGVSTEVVAGPDANRALAETTWIPGELLICGSSSAGPLRRVFVGDMSLKILRAAPRPVVVLAWSATHSTGPASGGPAQRGERDAPGARPRRAGW